MPYDSAAKFPIYRQDPLFWEPFWPNLKAALKRRPHRFEFSFGTVLKYCASLLIQCFVFWVGAESVWLKTWWFVVSVLFLGVVLERFMDWTAWIGPSLWEVFRKPRFRGYRRILLVGGIAVTAWSLHYWHYGYIRSSHFKLAVTGAWIISNITDYPGVPRSYPVASVFFSHLVLTNLYAPAKPTDWRLVATFPSGEELIGIPAFRSSDFSVYSIFVGKDSLIWGRQIAATFDPIGGIGNGNIIGAPAEFVFPGVRADTILSPATTLAIQFKGLNETVQTTAPPHLREVPSFPK